MIHIPGGKPREISRWQLFYSDWLVARFRRLWWISCVSSWLVKGWRFRRHVQKKCKHGGSGERERKMSGGSGGSRRFLAVDYSNEMVVPDVSVSWLYNPHSLLALAACCLYLTRQALSGYGADLGPAENLKRGLWAVAFVYLVLGLLVFPSGPFIRPHPTFWRLVFGITTLYLFAMILLLFQNVEDARKALAFIDPTLNKPLQERSYANDCSFTWEAIWPTLNDRFIIAHFFGWLIISLVVRNRSICWISSILWEFIEISLTHMLPNFAECWWDQLILDVLLCNGLGIQLGFYLCNYFEVQEYRWSGLMSIPTISGKIKRLAAQFTAPESWTKVRWEPYASVKRFFAANIIIIGLTLIQLNSFFLKTLLWIPPENDLNIYRLLLLVIACAVACRQLYLYIADPNIHRLGTQAWVVVAIIFTEVLIIIKFSRGEFPIPAPTHAKLVMVLVACFYIFATLSIITRSGAEKKRSKIQ